MSLSHFTTRSVISQPEASLYNQTISFQSHRRHFTNRVRRRVPEQRLWSPEQRLWAPENRGPEYSCGLKNATHDIETRRPWHSLVFVVLCPCGSMVQNRSNHYLQTVRELFQDDALMVPQ